MRLSFVLSFISIFIYSIYGFAQDYFVKEIEIQGLVSIPKEEFIYLLGVKENERFKVEDITKGIKRVFLKDIFEEIIVNYDAQSLKISIKEKPVVNSIEIKGNKHFPESFYIKILNFKEGDRLKESKLKASINLIKSKLYERGFINSDIKINKLIKDNFCKVEIYVDEGQPCKIREIKWEGDVDDYIINFFKLEPGDIFDQEAIKESIKKLKKSLEKEGYIGTEISYSFKNDSLTFSIKKGKILRIRLLGAESIEEKELKNIILAHLKEKIDENVIRDSVNSIISLYSERGFKNVNIIPLVESKDNEWEITYIVKEKHINFVEEIKISSKFSEEIKEILTNKEGQPINYNKLESDRRKIEEYLRAKGFYTAKVSPAELTEKNQKVRIFFDVQEGKQVRIKSIYIEKINEIKETKEILEKYTGKPFHEGIIIELKRVLRDFYLKNGYLYVNIDATYEIEEDSAKIFFKIDPGEKKYFGRSIILGNRKTKTKFIYQRLLPKENQPYNPYLLDQERQILYGTGLFSLIDIKNQIQDSNIDLIYNFEELPAGAIEFGVGYGEYEKLKAFIDFSYINLFGMNKQIFSRFELNTLETRVYTTYIDPWIGKKLSFKSSLMFERANVKNIDTKEIIYKIKRYGLSTGFEKKFTDTFKAEILYELNYSKTWDVLPEVVISNQDIGEILTSGVKLSFIYDSRDNPFDPEKGILGGLTIKLTSKSIGSEINFLKSSFYINKYIKIAKGFILATSLRSGLAWLYDDTKELPISERYFLGGRDTIRGYPQNTVGPKRDNQPTGGNAFLMGNIELRNYLGKNLFLVNFLDFGNVWKRVGDVDPSDLKYTTGIGFRYKTPIGLIRVDYGHKLNRQKGESSGEIHFSIGHAF
ncbi:MAG: BamA/TamA family outer membrane protein [Thermodesulfovibrionaceae bacterium]